MPLGESFQLRLTLPQMEKIDACVRLTGMGRAEHIRRAIDYYLQAFRTDQEIAKAEAEQKAHDTTTARMVDPERHASAPEHRQAVKVARR